MRIFRAQRGKLIYRKNIFPSSNSVISPLNWTFSVNSIRVSIRRAARKDDTRISRPDRVADCIKGKHWVILNISLSHSWHLVAWFAEHNKIKEALTCFSARYVYHFIEKYAMLLLRRRIIILSSLRNILSVN